MSRHSKFNNCYSTVNEIGGSKKSVIKWEHRKSFFMASTYIKGTNQSAVLIIVVCSRIAVLKARLFLINMCSC